MITNNNNDNNNDNNDNNKQQQQIITVLVTVKLSHLSSSQLPMSVCLSAGMTKVKVGKEDQSSNEFVEKRRSALERYEEKKIITAQKCGCSLFSCHSGGFKEPLCLIRCFF